MALAALTLLAMLHAPAAQEARDHVTGRFDYYVLALSWSPSWCMLKGDERNAPECRDGAGLGFVLHGLWPQYEAGWPSDCRTDLPDPRRRQNAAQTDLFRSAGLAWHQWKKHGRCSGLTADAYFALSRRAFAAIDRPWVFKQLSAGIWIAPAAVEAAFLEANPSIPPSGITITCRNAVLHEVKICLTRELAFRACGLDTRVDCRLNPVYFPKMR
ncbi:MAG: ribonuclease T2 [Pseudomonadota bacterium]